MAMLENLIQMMSQMLTMSGGSGQVLPGGSGAAALPQGSRQEGQAPALGGGSGPVPSTGEVAAPTGAAQMTSAGGASPVKIGPGTRVLEIGDSHTVGAFGKELDAKLRSTGAQVSTYASAGATASTFVNGKSTKYGYWQKETGGQERTVGYGQSAQTPRLDDLIAKEKPQVIVVNLGANFRGGHPKSEVDQLGQVAQKHGIPIVWVGPPKTAKDSADPSSLVKFDREMASAVAPYGKYISSNRHTPKYSGGDGIHYSGSQGTQLSKQWANGVFTDILG